MTAPEAPEDEPARRHALVEGGALVLKAAARAALVLVVYAIVGAAVSWTAFGFAAGDIWQNFHAGPGGAHAGGVAIVFFVILLFTAPGFVTLVYLIGFPFLFLLLGKREAVRAAVHRALREKKAALSGLLVEAAMRAATTAGAVPGGTHGRAAVRRLDGAVRAAEGSRPARFILRAVVRAVHLDELVTTADFVERAKADPEATRIELARAIEPRLDALGAPSYRPLLAALGVIVALTLARGLWCPFL